ncbi:MAG: hypothetical protein HZA52_10355 [Planctomycetes bacterium]|nr:hypothetical protein [Planctomycetota bacterium]
MAAFLPAFCAWACLLGSALAGPARTGTEQPLGERASKAAELARTHPRAGLEAAQAVLADALASGTEFERSRAYAAVGIAYFSLGRMPEALEQHTLGLRCAELAADRAQIGKRHQSLASILGSQGKLDEAWEHLRIALDAADATDDADARMLAKETMALVEQARGHASEALELYRDALRIARERADAVSLSRLSYNIATLKATQGDERGAIADFETALAESADGQRGSLFAYAALGHAYSNTGEPLIGRQYYSDGLAIGLELDDPRVVAQCALALGWASVAASDPSSAGAYFDTARAAFERTGDVAGMASTDAALGLNELDRDNPVAAHWYAERGWAIGCELEIDHLTYELTTALSRTHAALGDYREAHAAAMLLAQTERRISEQRASERYAALDAELRREVAGERFEHERLRAEQALFRSEWQRNAAIGGVLTLGIVCALVIRNGRTKLRANRELEQRNREISERSRTVEDLNANLSRALAEVKQLSGLLPICSFCKDVRDDRGYWNQVEEYLSRRSPIAFSHGICPRCAEKHYGSLLHRAPDATVDSTDA